MAAIDVRKSLFKVLIVFWAPVLLWMGYIFYFSSLQGKDIPSLFPFQDIFFHCLTYLVLAFLFSRAVKNTFLIDSMNKIIIITLIFGIVYGLSDELHQAFVPGRNASSFDLLIDAAGSLFGGLIYKWQR